MCSSDLEGQKAGNAYRRKNGMDELELLGWAVPPRYNEKTHNLEWATKIHSIGAPADEISINFNTRLLGRKGVMEVTLVCDPADLDAMIAEQEKILTGFSYIEGERYAEFRKNYQADRAAAITGAEALAKGVPSELAVKVEAGIQAGTPAETVVEKLKTDTATNSATRPALDQTATLLRITGGQAGFLKLVKRT